MTRPFFPTHYRLYLFIIVVSGCAQQSPSHVVISEAPATSPILSSPPDPDRPDNFPAEPQPAPSNLPAVQSDLDLQAAIDSSSILTDIAKPPDETKPAAASPRIKPEPRKTTQYQTVWERMVSLYSIPDISNKRVDQYLQWYLDHPSSIARIQERAEPYLFFILNEIESKKIPGELALLPAVESAFKPHAHSSSQAAGLWQFIPSTGLFFGLKQNWWYDGRRDVISSTRAATQYLKELSADFQGDWLLALASYNAGKGSVRRAIKKNRKRQLKTDFWSLKLPRETMNYVPRLLAIARIFASPEKYNQTLHDIPDQPYFEVVNIESQLDLGKALEMAQTPIDDFVLLNPGFNRWSTDPDGPHRLLIPVEKAVQFKDRLASLSSAERMKWVRHKILPGENLSGIAKKYNTNIEIIKQSNRLPNNRIRAGKVLMIPIHQHPKFRSGFQPPENLGRIYTVKKGDTLWYIARKFSVSSKDIARWNQLSLNGTLRPGQKLIIKPPKRAEILSNSPSLRSSYLKLTPPQAHAAKIAHQVSGFRDAAAPASPAPH